MRKVSNYLLLVCISILLPILLLIGIEYGLRAYGYGVDLDHLFLQTPKGDYLCLNKDISKRYFTQSQATNGNIEFFKKKKQTNTFRVFVLGESAAMGFPYTNNISFQRMLKYQLQKDNPEKDIEIINLSLTAINSYTFYDFAKEIVHYEPDAIFIYGGHNEYYGALGVASSNTLGDRPSMIRFAIRLRQLRLSQWLEALKTSIMPQQDFSDNLMKYVVKEQVIPYKSQLFARGLEQFRQNMSLTLNLFHKHHIPVFLSTVGVNLKDLKPFNSITDKSIDKLNANEYYALGQQLLEKQDTIAAYRAFNMARELDALRFRAPEEINNIIKELAEADTNVSFVDSEAAFKAESPYGIPGHKLLLEHVHPTIEGHRLITRCFLNALYKSKLLKEKGLQIDNTANLYDYPVLEFDSLTGEYACLQLRKGFPFYEKDLPEIKPQNEIEKSAMRYIQQKNWFQSMDALYQYALKQKQDSLCLEITKVRCIDNPYDVSFLNQGGTLAEIRKNYTLAKQFYYRSFRLYPSTQTAQNIIAILLRLDQPEKAIPYIDYIIHNGNAQYKELLDICQQIIQLKNNLKQHPSDSIRHTIQTIYLNIGNQDAANQYKQ